MLLPLQERWGDTYWKKHFDSLLNQELITDDYVYKISPAVLRCKWLWAAADLEGSED